MKLYAALKTFEAFAPDNNSGKTYSVVIGQVFLVEYLDELPIPFYDPVRGSRPNYEKYFREVPPNLVSNDQPK